MDCRIVEVEQNSDDWLALRRGRITASRLGDVMARPETKRYMDYRAELVLELMGHEDVEATPEWFMHGREMEPYAISTYEFKYDCSLAHDLLCIHNDYDWLSCSPDGLLLPNLDQGQEFKCRKLYKNYRKEVGRVRKYKALGEKKKCVPPMYAPQIQGCMWVTGFKFWWYVNYYQDLDTGKWAIERVEIPRDQAYIDRMEERAKIFIQEVYDLAGLEFEI